MLRFFIFVVFNIIRQRMFEGSVLSEEGAEHVRRLRLAARRYHSLPLCCLPLKSNIHHRPDRFFRLFSCFLCSKS